MYGNVCYLHEIEKLSGGHAVVAVFATGIVGPLVEAAKNGLDTVGRFAHKLQR